MSNYNNSIIYKIVCNDLSVTDLYVGSTTDFTKRKYVHKGDCNNVNRPTYNSKVYTSIRSNGGWTNWSVIMVEQFQCNSSIELRTRERCWMESLQPTLNSKSAISSQEELIEYCKQYRLDNTLALKDHKKQYYQDHPEKLKTKYVCGCGGKYTNVNKSHHSKSMKHIKYLQGQIINN